MISNNTLIGNWKNSKVGTKGIERFTLSSIEDGLSLTIHGAEGGVLPTTLSDINVTMHTKSRDSIDCIAFHGNAQTESHTFSFAGNINKGLVIIATYIVDKEGVENNTFIREFFYKLK